MVLVHRTLTKYGYPTDRQEKAIQTVMKQTESLTNIWAGSVVYETNTDYQNLYAAEEGCKYEQ